MRKKRFLWLLCFLFLLGSCFLIARTKVVSRFIDRNFQAGEVFEKLTELFRREPKEVRMLRKKEVAQTEEGHLEYYFKLLTEEEKRAYRELLDGVRKREPEIYLTISEDKQVDRVYHALLKDHPEIFWIHNRKKVYKTTITNAEYCTFTPGYGYTEEKITEILASMELAYEEVCEMLPTDASEYDKVKTVYTYLIDLAKYQMSDDDQSIAGIFWKKEAVCAGYAGATQYLLERMGMECIYVDGSAKGSTQGHAWNIVKIDGQYYYVDTTNGDQPEFLEGDAVQMAEHKTTIYDYLCPFPEEYEVYYTPSEEFQVPSCQAVDKNFYVMNQACFSSYDRGELYNFCRMRLDNGAAVIRFKFSTTDAFYMAYEEWIQGEAVKEAARYYMELYGLQEVEYHYGVLQNLKTIYFMF